MTKAIGTGDRFYRIGGVTGTYRVVRLVEFDTHSAHYVLISETADRRLITVGVTVLQDTRQWGRLDSAERRVATAERL